MLTLFAVLALLHITFGIKSVFQELSSSTAAAWIQAFGALAAIGIAIWVSHRSERISEINAKKTSKYFIEMAESAIGGLFVSSSHSSEESFIQTTRFIGELKEVQLIGQLIPLGQLPPDMCKHVLTARIMVGRCVDLGVEIGKHRQVYLELNEGLQSYPRDAHTIALALIKGAFEEIKNVNKTCKDS